MEATGINIWYLVIQVAVLGVACLTPLAIMWLAFRFARQRQEALRGELLATQVLTAEGIQIEAAWLPKTTAVEVYRHRDGLYLKPVDHT